MSNKSFKNADDIKQMLSQVAQQEAQPNESLAPRIMQSALRGEKISSSEHGIIFRLFALLKTPIIQYAAATSFCLIFAVASFTTLGSRVEHTFEHSINKQAEVESFAIEHSRLLDVLESNFGKTSYVPSGFTALSLTLLAAFLLSKRRYVAGIISAALAGLFLLVPLMLSQF